MKTIAVGLTAGEINSVVNLVAKDMQVTPVEALWILSESSETQLVDIYNHLKILNPDPQFIKVIETLELINKASYISISVGVENETIN